MEIQHVLQEFLQIDSTIPGLIRVQDRGHPVWLTSKIDTLSWPRRLPVEISSYLIFERAVMHFKKLQHSRVLTPPQQLEQGTVPPHLYLLCVHLTVYGDAADAHQHARRSHQSLSNSSPTT